MADRKAYKQPQIGPVSTVGAMQRIGTKTGSPAALVAGDLAANKTVGLFIAPKGFVLTEINIVVTDMDTGATLSFAIGDSVLDNRFVTVNTSAQAGGTVTTLAATGLRYKFLADTEIVWKTIAAATGAVAGTVTVDFIGYLD